AVLVLMAAQPAAGALVALSRQVLAGVGESPQGEPGAVDVVAAPAAVPGAVLVLLSVQESHRAPDRFLPARRCDAGAAKRLESAARDVLAAGIDHRVVVREGDERQDLVVAVAVEGWPAAIGV